MRIRRAKGGALLKTIKFKPSLFYQYLLSYMVLLFLPLAAVGVLGYDHFADILRNQVLDSNRNHIAQIGDSMDTKLNEMANIATQISLNNSLVRYKAQDLNATFNTFKQLNYSGANQFFYDVLYYPRGSKYIFSADSSYRLEDYYDLNTYRNWPYEKFIADLNMGMDPEWRMAEPIVHPNHTVRSMLTYVVPIPFGSTAPYATVVFQIREDTIREMLRTAYTYRDGDAIILDEHGRVMATLAMTPLTNSADFPKVIEQSLDSGSQHIQLDGETYYLSHIRSKVNGWTYLTVIPERELLEPVRKVKNNAVLAMALIVFFGIVIIYLGMQLNYNPVRKLIGKVEDSKPAVLRQQFIDLVKGRFSSWAEFNDKVGELGLFIPDKSLCYFLLLQFEDPNRAVSNLFPEGMTVYGVEWIEENQWVGLAVEPPGTEWEETGWLEWHHWLLAQPGGGVTVGMGEKYRDIRDMPKSYIEASMSLQYQLIKGKDHVIFFRETGADNRSIDWYPKQLFEQIYLKVKQADACESEQIVRSLATQIRENSRSLFTTRYLCWETLNTVMKARMDVVRHLDQAQAQDYPDLFQVMKLTRMEELEQLLIRTVRGSCEEIGKCCENEDALLAGMKQYLERRYADNQFTVREIADQFSMSLAHLGKYFKEKTGCTLSEYIHRLRIDKAKQLLRSTDLQLLDIVQTVGYQDVSSFIRKFKAEMSITPGEYRKLFQSEASSA
jgi:AraC-like DNA-binding protein